ncbi:dicarboxylate/amino acid:cation symporter [Aquimarina gracilis]
MFLGALAGILWGNKILFLKPLGDMFIDLLIMAAIPLVFFNLVAGLLSMESIKTLGGVGLKVMGYYITTTVIAIVLGIVFTSIIKPGIGFKVKEVSVGKIGEVPDIVEILMNMYPKNIFKSFTDGNLIQIVVFGVLLGIAILSMKREYKEPLKNGFELIAKAMQKLIGLIMKIAPLCLGALIAVTIGEYGAKVLGSVAKFIGTVGAAQIVMVIFYMILMLVLTKTSPLWFLKKTKELYATTIATTSSLASLTVALDVADNKLKLPQSIFNFTLPLGAQFNKDGTSIMLSTILIFTAQAVGWEISFSEMIQIILVGLLLSEGSTGIPGGGFVIATMFVQAFGLPIEVAVIVGGIYRIIDMGNTTVNCMSDMVATVIISKYEMGWQAEDIDFEKIER